jgi:outer membrane lipoprotein-sorting protein
MRRFGHVRERLMAEHAESILRGISVAFAILIANSATGIAYAADPAGPAAAAPSPAAAAPSPTAAAPSPEAVAALRKAIAYHREARDLALKFSASVYNAALDKRDEYTGRLLLKGADKFRLEIPGGVYVSDGKTYWEYHAKTKQAIRRDAADREGAPSPGEVLLRFLDSDPLSAAPVREDGKEWIGLRLDPARAMKNLDSLAVLLDKSSYALHQVSSRDVSGNEARYTVVSVKRNSGLKDGEFAFEPPKGAEVVDMRGE